MDFSSGSKRHRPRILAHHDRSERPPSSHQSTCVLTLPLPKLVETPFLQTTLNPFPYKIRRPSTTSTLRGRQKKLICRLLVIVQLLASTRASTRLNSSTPLCPSTMTWSSPCHTYPICMTLRCQVRTCTPISYLPMASTLFFSQDLHG